MFLNGEFVTNFAFLESLLSSSPSNGRYFCGRELTAVDILLQFPLEGAVAGGLLSKEKYPKLTAFVDANQKREAYKKGVQRVIDETGEYSMNLRAK